MGSLTAVRCSYAAPASLAAARRPLCEPDTPPSRFRSDPRRSLGSAMLVAGRARCRAAGRVARVGHALEPGGEQARAIGLQDHSAHVAAARTVQRDRDTMRLEEPGHLE